MLRPRRLAIALTLSSALLAQDPPAPQVATADLPSAREASPAPDDARSTILAVASDGRVSVDGTTVEPGALPDALFAAAKRGPERGVEFHGGTVTLSDRDVVIRIPSGVSSVVLDRVLDLLARARMVRPWLAVREGSAERAFPLLLPDPGAGPTSVSRVRLAATLERAGTGPLYRALKDAARSEASLRVQVEPRVAIDDVVEVFDVAKRAGMETLQFYAVATQTHWRAYESGGLPALLAAVQPPVASSGRQFEDIAAARNRDDRIAAAIRAATDEDDPAEPAMFNAAVGLGGGAGGIFGGRGGGRAGLGERGGREIAESIGKGLDWLRDQQAEEGWFGDRADASTTALALLAFLADGSTMRSGPWVEPVKHGVRWLRTVQHEDGRFGGAPTDDGLLTQALATLALVEAAGLSAYRVMEPDAQRAFDRLLAMREDDGVWRISDDRLHAVSWCLQACRAGRDLGLEVDDDAGDATLAWLLARAGAADAARGAAEVALFGAYLRGDAAAATAAAETLLPVAAGRVPSRDAPEIERWLHGSYAIYQAGGRSWTRWADALTTAILAMQDTGGDAAGSWAPAADPASSLDRVRTTARMCLTLQSYYRFTRLAR